MRARFDIASDGGCQVTLLTTTGNPQLDAMTLSTLGRWRWAPAVETGKPVSTVQIIRFVFLVE